MERIFKIAFGVVLAALMLVTVGLVVWAAVQGFKIDEVPTNPEVLARMYPQFYTAVNTLLHWCYALIALSVISIVLGFVWNLVEKPKALIMVGVVTAVAAPILGVSYFLASKHAGMFVLGSDGGIFKGSEVIISETCLFATYAVAGLLLVSVVASTVYSVIRKYI